MVPFTPCTCVCFGVKSMVRFTPCTCDQIHGPIYTQPVTCDQIHGPIYTLYLCLFWGQMHGPIYTLVLLSVVGSNAWSHLHPCTFVYCGIKSMIPFALHPVLEYAVGSNPWFHLLYTLYLSMLWGQIHGSIYTLYSCLLWGQIHGPIYTL